MKQKIMYLKNGIVQYLRNFPIEAMLGIVFFTLYIIDDAIEDSNYYPASIREVCRENGVTALLGRNAIHNVLLLFPVLFVLVYRCRTFFKREWPYYLSALAFIPLLFINLSSFINSIGYGVTLLLSFFLLLIERHKRDNHSFAGSTVQTLQHLGLSMLFGLLFYIACMLIHTSVLFIFGLYDTWKFPQYAGMFTCFLIVPLLFCQLQHKKQANWQPAKFIGIVLNFILSPSVIIYTGILYLYFITIAWHGELPKGGVAYMVLAFIITALGGRMAQLIVTRRYYDWFYNYFSFIALPPLIIFWIGTMERICTYSWTESRVYLFAAGILMTTYMLFLLSKRLGNYRLMLLISSACIILLTFVPFISAKSIGITAQKHRFEHLARALNVWDNERGTLKTTMTTAGTHDSKDSKNIEQLTACYSYLKQELGEKELTKLYGQADFSFLAPSSKKEDTLIRITNTNRITIPEGYKFYAEISHNTYQLITSQDTIAYVTNKDTGETVLSFNLEKQFKPHLEKILSWETDTLHDLTPFIVKNDSCMLIIHSISYRKEKKMFHCNGGTLFFK